MHNPPQVLRSEYQYLLVKTILKALGLPIVTNLKVDSYPKNSCVCDLSTGYIFCIFLYNYTKTTQLFITLAIPLLYQLLLFAQQRIKPLLRINRLWTSV